MKTFYQFINENLDIDKQDDIKLKIFKKKSRVITYQNTRMTRDAFSYGKTTSGKEIEFTRHDKIDRTLRKDFTEQDYYDAYICLLNHCDVIDTKAQKKSYLETSNKFLAQALGKTILTNTELSKPIKQVKDFSISEKI